MTDTLAFRTSAGHGRLATLLAHAIARDTLPPTLLFHGPSGVGKWRMARALSAVMNCATPLADVGGLAIDACGACQACGRIARDVHVDVIHLEPDERASIKIDVVRDMLGRTNFRPFEGKRRFVLIRDADALEPSAQNALLKSLEEPPPGTIFVLTTAVPGALLPTVRSRCMRLRFARLPEAIVAEMLHRDHGMDVREAASAAALADGSIGQALALGSTDLAVLRETALSLLQQAAFTSAAQPRLQAAAVIVGLPKKERPRADISLILRLAASMLRDIELLKAGGQAPAMANAVFEHELGALTRAFAGDRARDAFGAVDRGLAALERNAGVKVVAEWVALHI